MPMLNDDNDMIERMEGDLVAKAQLAYLAAALDANIHGVFSLDDLETINQADLCKKIGVGVGYAGAEPVTVHAPQGSQPGGKGVQMTDFLFHLILAVPHGEDCLERYSATRLLTILRRSINGKPCDGDTASRTWAFVKEFPNITESTESMLYYSQVWRIMLPARTY